MYIQDKVEEYSDEVLLHALHPNLTPCTLISRGAHAPCVWTRNPEPPPPPHLTR